jgi:hypothetical protein
MSGHFFSLYIAVLYLNADNIKLQDLWRAIQDSEDNQANLAAGTRRELDVLVRQGGVIYWRCGGKAYIEGAYGAVKAGGLQHAYRG